MKKLILLLLLFITIFSNNSFSQVSPFQVAPKFMFQKGAGLNFMGGTLPTSPILSPPVYLAGNPSTNAQEGGISVCDTTRNVVLYSPNGYDLFNSANTIVNIPVASKLKGGTSSTQLGTAFPDPANPTSQYYIVTANVDPFGGSVVGASNGVNYAVYNTAGALISSGSLIATANTGEYVTVSSDMNGGYWIITHQGGASHGKNYYTWHVTAGGVSAMNTIAGTILATGYQGSLKISNCQNKIGFANFGTGVEIYNWNPTTGTLGSLIYSNTTNSYGMLYGAEFSPDGSKFYYTSLIDPGKGLYQIDMNNSNALTTVTNTSVNSVSEFGTMQLCFDNKIYVINSSNFDNPALIPAITAPNNPTATAGYNNSYFKFTPTPFYPNFYRGIANLAWINPNKPVINQTMTASCNIYKFFYEFKTYFNQVINVVPNSEIWDFGDGTGPQAGLGLNPTHTFPISSGATYTVTLTVTDAVCNQTWSNTFTVNITCSLPVELLSFTGTRLKNQVNLNWLTAIELNADKFMIEKSSDGINFKPIGTVLAQGSNSKYRLIDVQPNSGDNYYRLIQYDKNGDKYLSRIILVTFDDVSIMIYPNPFTNSTTVYIYGIKNSTINVYDVLGRSLAQYLQGDREQVEIADGLSSGNYVVQVVTADNEYRFNVVKK